MRSYRDGTGFVQSSERTTLIAPPRRHPHQVAPEAIMSGPGASQTQQSQARSTLAPPVEFASIANPHPRRSNPQHHARPTLSGAASSGMGIPREQYPSTPPLQGPPGSQVLKTPSQKTAEQDAIETLLFMSSPGNSATFARAQQQANGHHPHSQLSSQLGQPDQRIDRHGQSRPQRHQMLSPRKMAAAQSAKSFSSVDAIPLASPPRPSVRGYLVDSTNLQDERGIDRVLDQLRRAAGDDGEQDSDSSEGED